MVRGLNFQSGVLILILSGLFSLSAYAQLTTKLSRTQLSENESTTLTIESSEKADIPTSFFQAMAEHFDIENQGTSSETSCVNFKCTSTSKSRYLLSPKETGIFTIPALTIENETAPAITVNVKPANRDPNQGQLPPLYAEIAMSKTQAYVGEQIILTLKLNSAIQLSSIEPVRLSVPDANVVDLSNNQYQRELGGSTYVTIEFTYALFPQKSGTLAIPSTKVDVIIPDNRRQGGFSSFFNSGRREGVRTNTLTLDVLPASTQANEHWLPAQSVIIKGDWSGNPETVRVGDSITRDITVSALGLAAEQLPELTIPSKPAYKTYQEKPELENKQNEHGIIGIRQEKIAIVPNQAGELTLPAQTVEWFDIESKTIKKATLPSTTLHVQPALGVTTKTPIESNSTATSEPPLPTPAPVGTIEAEPAEAKIAWTWIAALVISLLLNILLLVLLLKKPATQNQVTEKEMHPHKTVDLSKALQSGHADILKQAMLEKARLTWPNQRFYSLADIARQLDDKSKQTLIYQVDKAVYQKTSLQMNEKDLHALFETESSEQDQSITSLYPTQ